MITLAPSFGPVMKQNIMAEGVAEESSPPHGSPEAEAGGDRERERETERRGAGQGQDIAIKGTPPRDPLHSSRPHLLVSHSTMN
jgi:hypothetical protein